MKDRIRRIKQVARIAKENGFPDLTESYLRTKHSNADILELILKLSNDILFLTGDVMEKEGELEQIKKKGEEVMKQELTIKVLKVREAGAAIAFLKTLDGELYKGIYEANGVHTSEAARSPIEALEKLIANWKKAGFQE